MIIVKVVLEQNIVLVNYNKKFNYLYKYIYFFNFLIFKIFYLVCKTPGMSLPFCKCKKGEFVNSDDKCERNNIIIL